jgi:hypothetical protein
MYNTDIRSKIMTSESSLKYIKTQKIYVF